MTPRKGFTWGHRKFSSEFKYQVVLDMLKGSKSQAEICCEHNLDAAQVSGWQHEFLAHAPQFF